MTLAEIQNRLSEIASISLQELEDDVVLALLKERKELLAEEARVKQSLEQEKQDQEKQQEEARRVEAEAKARAWEEKRNTLLARLEAINQDITPDKGADQLLALIQDRKLVEAELEVFTVAGENVPETPIPQSTIESAVDEKPEEVLLPEEPVTKEEVPQEPKISDMPSEKITITSDPSYVKTSHVSEAGKVSGLEDSSEARIVLDTSLQSGEYQGYLNELKENLNSLGTFLQALPTSAKRNRAFMIEVAKIDPAYAMHYADKETLKKDESFNVTIAGMNNQRNTGNPISEMLPEMRTGAVLLAGVKNDFRNVRFLRPEMPEYEEILSLAKKGALEAIASLHGAHDLQFLLPPILQKDKNFMAEVEHVIKKA